MAKPRYDRRKDLLRPPLDHIIDLDYQLVRLAGEIDWGFLLRRFCAVCRPGPGQPTRLAADLFIIKHMHGLSDKLLCARWLENSYGQFFCGEACFRHEFPFERPSLTRRRQRLVSNRSWRRSERASRWPTSPARWPLGTSSRSPSTPRCSPRRSRTRPTHG
jgi:transposase, IS5 family